MEAENSFQHLNTSLAAEQWVIISNLVFSFVIEAFTNINDNEAKMSNNCILISDSAVKQ